MALLSTDSSPISYLAHSVINVTTTSLPYTDQCTVLCALLFIMYTTHLSILISSLSLCPHLYADDTQPFLLFHPSDFQASITHLQNALTQIISKMTFNLLSLNSSKTGCLSVLFLLIKRYLNGRWQKFTTLQLQCTLLTHWLHIV